MNVTMPTRASMPRLARGRRARGGVAWLLAVVLGGLAGALGSPATHAGAADDDHRGARPRVESREHAPSPSTRGLGVIP
jgi:hypothetical protein